MFNVQTEDFWKSVDLKASRDKSRSMSNGTRKTMGNLFLEWNWRNKLVWMVLQWRLRKICGERIMQGPFKGMQYLGTSLNSALFPKIIGMYEYELHSTIQRILQLRPRRIINIGAGEGFYTVGFLAAGLETAVCFERSPRGKELIAKLARMNGVSEARLTVLGNCTRRDLGIACGRESGSLVLMDVEGGELMLLDPLRVPHLSKHFILVETHDHLLEGIHQELLARFSESHSVESIAAKPRSYHDANSIGDWFIQALPIYFREYLVTEYRPEGISWLWMEPRGESCLQTVNQELNE